MTPSATRIAILAFLLALIPLPTSGSAQDGPQVVLRVLISPTHPFDPERVQAEYRGAERTLYAYLVMESASTNQEARAGAVTASLVVYHTPHGGPEISPFQPAAGWRTVPRGTPVLEGSGPSISAPSVLGWTKLTFRPDQVPMATVSVCPPADESDGYSPRVHGAGGTPPRLWLTYGAGINHTAPPAKVYPRWICSPPHGLVPAGDANLARLIREEGLSQFPVRSVWSRPTDQYLTFNPDGSVRRDVPVPHTFTDLVERSGGTTDERSLIAFAGHLGRSVICRLSLETGEIDTLPPGIQSHIHANGTAFVARDYSHDRRDRFQPDGGPAEELPLRHGQGAFVGQEYHFIGWTRPATPLPWCREGGGDLEYCSLDANGRLLARDPINVYGCLRTALFSSSDLWAATVWSANRVETLVSGNASGVLAALTRARPTHNTTTTLHSVSDGMILCMRNTHIEIYDRMLVPRTTPIPLSNWVSFGMAPVSVRSLYPLAEGAIGFAAMTDTQLSPDRRANRSVVGIVDWSGRALYQFQDVPGAWWLAPDWMGGHSPSLTRLSDRLYAIHVPLIGGALYVLPAL